MNNPQVVGTKKLNFKMNFLKHQPMKSSIRSLSLKLHMKPFKVTLFSGRVVLIHVKYLIIENSPTKLKIWKLFFWLESQVSLSEWTRERSVVASSMVDSVQTVSDLVYELEGEFMINAR
jgi:hypothetical protein